MKFRCCRPSETERLENILNSVDDISDIQRNIIRERYLSVLKSFRSRSSRYSLFYHLGHCIMTVGSLIVPALMSVQYTDAGMNNGGNNTDYQNNVYWITWCISLLVTTSNGVLTLFKVDKKYFFLHTITEKLCSEGWQYFGLTGRYSGNYPNMTTFSATHQNQFTYFCHNVERLKIKQIEEEYYKQQDEKQKDISNIQQSIQGSQLNGVITSQSPPKGTLRPTECMYPPSPDQIIQYQPPTNTIITQQLPRDVYDIVESMTSKRQQKSDNSQEDSTNQLTSTESVVQILSTSETKRGDVLE